jgi:hypothetical protein
MAELYTHWYTLREWQRSAWLMPDTTWRNITTKGTQMAETELANTVKRLGNAAEKSLQQSGTAAENSRDAAEDALVKNTQAHQETTAALQAGEQLADQVIADNA